ncbi:AraC-like ligand-binding domain-containing protein [Kineococcus sp. SYSU DK001]|uniref:AraC-like ligand-binding domain-containing protein n=1 Tax=Kineococcus sp. SYSU DK001 TaxID=3383122 RepID=UPI003D7C6741
MLDAAGPGQDGFEAYRRDIARAFVPMTAVRAAAGPFSSTLTSSAAGPLQVSDIRVDAHAVHRTARQAAADEVGWYKVSLQLEGRCSVLQDGRCSTLGPGEFAIYDSTRPFSLTFPGRSRSLVVRFPRSTLAVPEAAVAELTASRLGDAATRDVLAAVLRTLQTPQPGLDPLLAHRLSHNVLDVLATVVDAHARRTAAPAGRGAQQVGRRALLTRVLAHVDRHLAEPDLSVGSIAAAHGVSVRYLQGLFQDEGTSVTRWIREERLARCRRELADPRSGQRSVSAVAAAWGLPDPSQFSRSFRAAYGESPRDFHRRCLGDPPAT